MQGLLRNCLSFAFWLLLIPVFGQGEELYFRTIGEGRGWSQNTINDILQDQTGYIWLATWSGLARFDGYEMKTYSYSQAAKGGLKSNKITCIYEDSKARLWVGTTYGGFYLYRPETEDFLQFVHQAGQNSLVNDNIWAIHEDRFGKLWIGTENGIDEFDPEMGTFKHFNKGPENGNLSHPFVYSICETADGILWVGCETGLNRLERDETGQAIGFFPYDLSPRGTIISYDDELRHNFIKALEPSQHFDSTLWIGTSIGLKKFVYDPNDIKAFRCKTYYHEPDVGLNHQFVADLLEIEAEKELWIATYNGLNILDLETGRFRYAMANKSRPSSLLNNTLKSLYLDSFGVAWIGTDKGLSMFNLNARPFRHLDLDVEAYPNSNLISSVQASSDGEGFWVASNGGGLSYIFPSREGGDWQFRHFPIQSEEVQDLANFIKDIAISPNGRMWVATKGAGVFEMQESFDAQGNKQLRNLKQYTKANQLSDDYFMSLTSSVNQGIWFGYWDKGVDWYDPLAERFYHFDQLENGPNLSSFPVISLLSSKLDETEYLWVATRGNGLFQFEFDQQKKSLSLIHQFKYQPNQSNSISNDFLNCLYLQNSDSLWIGTENGINILDISTGQIQHFFERDGLPDNWVQSIGSDQNGHIWAGSQKGLAEIQITAEIPQFTSYDIYDGLRNEFFVDNATERSSEGEMIFGTVSGLSIFDPLDIRTNNQAPKITLTELRVFNQKVPIGPMPNGETILQKSIAQTSQISLKHEQNVFSIEFVGLHTGESQNISYAHKLEGFDQDWVYTQSGNRLAHYTNLPYRSFDFWVKAANSDGVWSEPIKLTIKMRPPFWLTYWAYLIYLVLFIGLLLGVRKLTQLRAEYRHNIQLERVEREKLEEVAQMKQQFFTNISHELRTPLTLIISPLEQLIKERNYDRIMHRAFQRMNLNANRLLTMINQLLDIQKTESGLMRLKVAKGNLNKFVGEIVLAFQGLAEQQKIKLSFEPQKDEIEVYYDRDQLEKVLFNLLSNALKFTPAEGNVNVSLQVQTLTEKSANDARVLLQVSDDGMGIEEEQIEHIFDRFFQAESKYEAHRSGTGIGLSLSKNIVEAHHGQIWAKSQLGQGSSFFVSLPLGNAHFSEEEQIKAFADSESLQQYVQLPMETEISTLAPIKSTPSDLQVLLVEDNADIRQYLREKLETEYQIFEAPNGKKGLALALEKVPDLVVADIAMPEMDGISLCRELKSRVETSHIPVILLTARTSLIFKIDGLETGADDYITKPFNLRLLKVRINNLIDSRRKLRQKFGQNWELAHTDTVLNRLDERFLEEVQKAIAERLGDSEFSVESLAEALDLSRMQLYRKLKALIDQSPKKLIRSYRLREAANLLKGKQYNVSEITYMVGYNDLKSFREQFKKEFGLSPSAYSEAG